MFTKKFSLPFDTPLCRNPKMMQTSPMKFFFRPPEGRVNIQGNPSDKNPAENRLQAQNNNNTGGNSKKKAMTIITGTTTARETARKKADSPTKRNDLADLLKFRENYLSILKES